MIRLGELAGDIRNHWPIPGEFARVVVESGERVHINPKHHAAPGSCAPDGRTVG